MDRSMFVLYCIGLLLLSLGSLEARSNGLKIEALSSHVDLFPHTDAMLSCDVASQDPVTIRWQKDGKVIQNSKRVSIQFFGDGAFSTGVLVIQDSGVGDAGTYKCIAMTKDGRQVSTIIHVAMWEELGSGEEEPGTDWLQWSGTIG